MAGRAAGVKRFEQALTEWFALRGWKPAPFQREVWRRYRDGQSGLLVTPTGSGKTLAMIGGPLLQALAELSAPPTKPAKRRNPGTARARVLWITPLRALASDTVRALREPIDGLGLPWTVAMRTGDASARDKRLARQGKADVLVITPESLALLLSYPDTQAQLASLQAIVVDEWHALLDNKRGVLLQLCLARLRGWLPAVRIWGLSATLGNLEQARQVLLPHLADTALIRAATPRGLHMKTLLPQQGERFPWAGHLGLSQMQAVVEQIAQARTTLLFTNTRAQAELWYEALQAVWLENAEALALHHGSLDPTLRRLVEQGLREDRIRCVVATSSLDLGVDFPTVDQVIQLGSPKGMARLLQRAGRARHRPGQAGDIICVPTHALELAEYAAARQALRAGEVESRQPLTLSLDVLAQHCVTLALAGGFDADQLLAQVRTTHAYADLSAEDWTQVLQFITQGGNALQHYPEFCRVSRDEEGVYKVTERRVAFRHRLSIGTITSDGALLVRMARGGALGSVEESFLSRLRPGDVFQFAGRTLRLLRLQDMTAYVRPAKQGSGVVPRWQGGRMPMSTDLAAHVAQVLADPPATPELRALRPLLALQSKLSALPAQGQLLAEWLKTRDGWHLFLYPFAGRAVHEGLAAVLSLRWSQRVASTFGFSVNDYGLAISTTSALELDEQTLAAMLSPEALLRDLRAAVNMSELARRQFREIARVAGLLPPSLPGRALRSLRQLQASSSLLYDVLRQYDPGHILLRQAEREVLEQRLDVATLQRVVHECAGRQLLLTRPRTLTPLSFPLWAESRRGSLSSEDWKQRVQRAAQRLEQRHG
ncbi:MAG: ligase-associated DNA damage response DEXH box helicase [Stenotrophomonas sp.]